MSKESQLAIGLLLLCLPGYYSDHRHEGQSCPTQLVWSLHQYSRGCIWEYALVIKSNAMGLCFRAEMYALIGQVEVLAKDILAIVKKMFHDHQVHCKRKTFE